MIRLLLAGGLFLILLWLLQLALISGLRNGRVSRQQVAVAGALFLAAMPWYFKVVGGAEIDLPVLIWVSILTLVGAAVAARLVLFPPKS